MGRKKASAYTPLMQLADSRHTLEKIMGEFARGCVRAASWRRARNSETEKKRIQQAEWLGICFARAIIDPGDAHAIADLSTALAEYRLRWT
jgi:hypothetical protein